MKRNILTLAVLLIAVFATNAQQPTTIQFDKIVHDFGEITQKGGPVTYSFEFTNTGTEPLVIQSVKASCGCTTPGWTKEPVAPGEKGFVKATYRPSSPAAFDKSLTVSSTGNPNVVLRVKGKVVTAIEDVFPTAYGSLRLRSDKINMKQIMQGTTKKDSVEIINTGAEAMTVSLATNSTALSFDVVPATLKAGEKGFIRCTFNAGKKEWGNVSLPATIKINGKTQNDASVTVTANIMEDFSKMTAAEKANAPIADVANANVNFGEVKKGESIVAEYTIANTGKTKLLIHKTESSNSNIKIVAPSQVKPGKIEKVKVTMDTKKEPVGNVSYTLTFITNAPEQSILPVLLTGKIVN